MLLRLIFSFLLATMAHFSFAQEFASLKHYEKETGKTALEKGCWLKKDRKRNSEVWHQANEHNLTVDNGNEKYTTPEQIRDFYLWFDARRIEQGHEVKWIGLATIAASQLARVENDVLRALIVRNKEVVNFVREGCRTVFAYSFPKMRALYFAKAPLKGEAATAWDDEHGLKEQCDILNPVYLALSPKALKRLDKMAKGKGIFCLGVKKELRYEGDLLDCNARYKHGPDKLLPYYLKQH